MTAMEKLQRLGARELSKRVGPNMLRGLVISVFLHSAVISIGLVDWGGEPSVADDESMYDTIVVQLLQNDPINDPVRKIVRIKKPAPEVKIEPVPVDPEDLPIEDENKIDEPELDDPPRGLIVDDDQLADIVEGEPGGSLGENTVTIAGVDQKPWEIYEPREIEPQPLEINPQPEYPEMARKAGIGGKVLVWVLVNADGSVGDYSIVHVSAPEAGFDDAVEAVISDWKFTPAIQNDRPIDVWVIVPFKFQMKN